MDKEELYGEDRLAAETRIRNLLWTVSGDYDLSCELDDKSDILYAEKAGKEKRKFGEGIK